MKKINNNKFRGNAVYSLNYKFDSVSPAGKCSGTALDLIKRYNELAKEAQNNGDYVSMEVFRQYAEHYRKIVTEINERKYQNRDGQNVNGGGAVSSTENQNSESAGEVADEAPAADNGLVETQSAAAETNAESSVTVSAEDKIADKTVRKPRRTRAFTVVESGKPAEIADTEETAKPRRRTAARRSTQAADKEQTAE